ncbi:MAG: D-2-hydroxyacid dehydrogenase [Aeromonadales bacterium]|nr:D-2-hydroxyacid dehydrogenase [Aeromonadales bacterium]
MAKKLLIALDVLPRHIDLFKQAGDLQISVKKQSEVTADDVKDKNIIVGNVKPALLKDAKALEFLQLNSAGFDNYVGVLDKDIKLCTAVGSFSPAVGEHMLAMTFSLIRHFHLYRDKQLKKDWSDCGKIISVEGSTIALLGLGDIGRSYARKVKALGAAKVIGVRRNVNDKPDYIDEMYTLDELDKVLPQSDIVAMVLPSCKQTVQLVDKKFLSMMKTGAYLINVGRGDAINQDDLLEALRSDKLSGAALDVTVPEPLNQDSPLWSEPKLLLTPHVAGGFFLQETTERVIKIAANNVKAYLNNEPLKNEEDH